MSVDVSLRQRVSDRVHHRHENELRKSDEIPNTVKRVDQPLVEIPIFTDTPAYSPQLDSILPAIASETGMIASRDRLA